MKSAIAKKDESIADLRLNYEKAVEQNEHLQAMLDMNTRSKLQLTLAKEDVNGRNTSEVTAGRRHNSRANGTTASGVK